MKTKTNAFLLVLAAVLMVAGCASTEMAGNSGTNFSEKALAPSFAEFDRIAQINTERVLESFREPRVSDSMFGCSTG